MMDARKAGLKLAASIANDNEEGIIRGIGELVGEIERLQGLAKRGHGREFVESNGRFDVA